MILIEKTVRLEEFGPLGKPKRLTFNENGEKDMFVRNKAMYLKTKQEKQKKMET